LIAPEKVWYQPHPLSWVLAPAGALFCLLAAARRGVYRLGLMPSHAVPVPVVVVGNITVGGTGKTPLVIWLCERLRRRGYRPGVLIRGYGGRSAQWPREVAPDSDPAEVGDEAALLARRAGCPVMAGPDRVASARRLIEARHCDIMVCDDGLQHYRLRRTLEIAVVDGDRRFGNGRCLPAGPLREPLSRLRTADLVIVNGRPGEDECGVTLVPEGAVSLADPSRIRSLSDFSGTEVLAVAGIGNPERFFRMLEGYGIGVVPRPYRDHHPFTAADSADWADRTVLMTEKDAVKCGRFPNGDRWYVKVRCEPDARAEFRFEQLLDGLRNGQKAS